MRIISQDKTFDVNYNNCTLRLEKDKGYLSGLICGKPDEKLTDVYKIKAWHENYNVTLGVYESEEKAKEIMTKIQDCYIDYMLVVTLK